MASMYERGENLLQKGVLNFAFLDANIYLDIYLDT